MSDYLKALQEKKNPVKEKAYTPIRVKTELYKELKEIAENEEMSIIKMLEFFLETSMHDYKNHKLQQEIEQQSVEEVNKIDQADVLDVRDQYCYSTGEQINYFEAENLLKVANKQKIIDTLEDFQVWNCGKNKDERYIILKHKLSGNT
jgi:hypothetical protein